MCTHPLSFPRASRAAVQFRPLLILLALCAWPVAQAAPPGADLASVRAWLLEHSPNLRAMQAQAEAAQARIAPAAAWPDPMLGIELDPIDPAHPSLLPARTGATRYRIEQRIPAWGKRALAEQVARHEAAVEGDLLANEQREQLAAAYIAYVEFWYAGARLRLLDRRIERVRELQDVALQAYARGLAAQQDAIRAQVAGTRLQGERIETLASARMAAARLNALLGRAPQAPLAEPAQIPQIEPDLPGLAAALERIDAGAHPALRAGTAELAAAAAQSRLQRRQRWPDITLGVGAMQAGSRIEGYALMLEVDIPLQRRALHEREREAQHREEAAQARLEVIRNQLRGRLAEAWAGYDSASERARLVASSLQPQARAQFESALASYRRGGVDFDTLLEALDASQEADAALLDAQRDRLAGAAALTALLGDRS